MWNQIVFRVYLESSISDFLFIIVNWVLVKVPEAQTHRTIQRLHRMQKYNVDKWSIQIDFHPPQCREWRIIA
jgi:hypothetical protein